MQTQPLVRVVYASRATAECLANLDENIDQILASAISNNRLKGITGLLIAHRGWFLQALEGPTDEVYALFKHICTDRRHRDAILLGEGAVTVREFGLWSMCARQLSPTDAMILGELDRRPTFEPADFPERAVMRLLRTVAEVHELALTRQQDLASV
jgi:hypothetical protein